MSKKKGNRHEMEAKGIWADVYGEEVVERATSGGFQSADFFDLFDIIVWAGVASGMHLIQVKTNVASGVVEYSENCQGFRRYGDAFSTYMAIRYDAEGWRLVSTNKDGSYETLYDEREDPDVGGKHTPLSIGDGLERWLKVWCTGPDYPNDDLDAGEWREYV